MPREGKQRGKKPRQYEIVVVSLAEGGQTRSFRASRTGLVALGVLAFAACVGLTLAALIYTPIAMYVPIPNPLLEQRYGQQIVETQERLNDLAEEVLLLRDYNVQLRKAMGERIPGRPDSLTGYPPSLFAAAATPSTPQTVPEEGNSPPASSTGVPEQAPVSPVRAVVMPASEAERPTAFPLMMPTEGFVSQGFDPSRGHRGMDIAGRRGTPVGAAADGHVLFAGWTYDGGNMVILSHSGGYVTVYKHNQALLASAQATVERGEVVALLGTSGTTSSGPHLHFEVWKDGIPRDPQMYLLSSSRTRQ